MQDLSFATGYGGAAHVDVVAPCCRTEHLQVQRAWGVQP